jgi:hypothetical protein
VEGWKSDTTTGTEAALQADGNFALYAGTSIWSSNTCANCTGVGGAASPPAVYQLYLPGATSSCPCTAYMCIVVDLPSGGKDYYYAETDGAAFTKTLASCPS